MANFDWTKPCAYNEPQKHLFHREARKRLQALAEELFLPRHSYSIRSNKAGLAVKEMLLRFVIRARFGPIEVGHDGSPNVKMPAG